MLHKAWNSKGEMPYCFPRSSIKFQGHTVQNITDFDPNWAFPDCNSSLNSPMAMKCCTKLETAKERCPIVFQGHSSNFKVTRYKTSPILTQIGRFRTIGRSQLSNPSDLPCSGSSIKFRGHTGWKIDDSNPIWVRLLGRSQLSNPSDLPCFKVKHYFGHISGMVGPIDVNRKRSPLVGYWEQYVTLNFDLTHDFDHGCFKVKFQNSSWIDGLIDVKRKGSKLIWYWADCMTLTFDHTLDLGVWRSESEIALSREWGARLTMNEKDVNHPFITMILTCVTMVGWADVPDSDRGDFRLACRRHI